MSEFGRDVLSRVLAGAYHSIVMGLGATGSGLVIGVALELFSEDFVEAARARGEGACHILLGGILPDAWPPPIVETALRITFAILLGSALSFLGLGSQLQESERGAMIAESRRFIAEAPWIGLAHCICLCLLLIVVNIVGKGLRDLLNPRLRLTLQCAPGAARGRHAGSALPPRGGAGRRGLARQAQPPGTRAPIGATLIEADGLAPSFRLGGRFFQLFRRKAEVRAVAGVALSLRRGQMLGWSVSRAAASPPSAARCCA